MRLNTIINSLKTNTKVRQVLALFSVSIIGIPIGIITSIVITRYLGPQGFGDYKFILSVFNFAIIIFTFGFYQSGNRALVLNNDRQKAREYYGAEFILTIGIFLIMSLFLVLYALFDKNIQEKQLDKLLLYIIPFGWVFLLLRYYEVLFQADNKIRLLSQVRLYPKIGFLIVAILIYFLFNDINKLRIGLVLALYILVETIVYVCVLFKIKLSFKNLKKRIFEIYIYNKSFGFNVYIGSVAALGFGQLTEILISYFGVDNSGVGFYSLALTFTLPLSLIPNTIATTHYKDFSSAKQIPKKLLYITIGLSLFSIIALWIIVPPFITYFYGEEFLSVVKLNFIVSFGVIAHGFGDFYNRYLGSNGQGKYLRNSSIIVGVVIMILNIAFIPNYGEYGASFARLFSGIIYMLIMIFYYVRYLKLNKNS